jgi:multidrug efflux system membrane fusion protein
VVPLAGVVRAKTGKDEYAVFVVGSEKGKLSAHMRPVKLGEAYGNTVAVLEGVQVGERVVTTGATLLNDGDAVVLIP